MRLIAALRQRIEDAAREVRIQALCASIRVELAAGRHAMVLEAYAALVDEIKARSPQQIARMERRRGLTA